MRRWVNPSQPDLLQIATWLGYFRGVMTLLFGLDLQYVVYPGTDLFRILVPALLAGGAYLMANGRRLGWRLMVVAAALPLVARVLLGFGISLAGDDLPSISPLDYDALGLIFEVALLALLVHPRSRQYEKVWLE